MEKAKILVVDDDPALSALVCISLEETGLYSTAVENLSCRALETARRFKPDVVVLDVNMPGKDGGDVAVAIGADRDLAGTPIVFFTSLVSPDEAELRDSSAKGPQFVAKKGDPAVLVRTIASVLADASAARPIRLSVPNPKAAASPEPSPTPAEQAPPKNGTGL